MRRLVLLVLLPALLVGLVAFAPAPSDVPAPVTPDEGLTAYVDPLIGSTPPGFTNPGPSLPHGMASPGPDTEGPANYGGYYAHNALITGFSQTHMSAGVYQGGVFPIMPFVGDVPSGDLADAGYIQPVPAYSSPYAVAEQHAEPGHYEVRLARSEVHHAITATERVALHRSSYTPELGTPRMIVDVARSLKGYRPSRATRVDERTFLIEVDQDGPDHTVFGAVRFDAAPSAVATLDGTPVAVGDTVTDIGFVADFAEVAEVETRIGLSFTDADGALRNLTAEAGDEVAFDDVRRAADDAWEQALGQVEVTSALDAAGATPASPRADADKVRLYTALYHHRLFPNLHSDVDGRYRGPDDVIHTDLERPHYSQFSLWDSYRGQNALLAVLDPVRYDDMLHSLADFADQYGVLPRWQLGPANPGYMSGDPAVQFVASGVCRAIGDHDLHQRLMDDITDTRAARPAVLDELGYLPVAQPAHPGELVEGGSRDTGTTLEYGVADAAAALVADRLGEVELAGRLAADSLRYRNVQDPATGWIRPRDADGDFAAQWTPESGYGFQEGTSWQYSWLAMHDWSGLVAGMGGDDVVQQRLDAFFNLPATIGNGFAWGNVQNKQTAFGIFYAGNQFAPGNEHDLEAPYTYLAAGAPWKTQAAVRAATSVYSATADGLPGNDDLGALSGWLVWNLLGVHPTIPGAPVYLVGSPTFPHATIHTPSGDLVIDAPGADEAAKYVTQPSLGGDELTRTWFTEDEWRRDGSLVMGMSITPDLSWGTAAEARPPSIADGLAPFGCGMDEE